MKRRNLAALLNWNLTDGVCKNKGFEKDYEGALFACRGLIGGATPGLLSGLSG
jgi:hypothetical protein